ncbi:MAG TPA: hypothetical protein VK797_24615 [Tepidisphaeraceae bacterium]|nr:hypothetical protein [Tepidisphaeraceae bacterium]
MVCLRTLVLTLLTCAVGSRAATIEQKTLVVLEQWKPRLEAEGLHCLAASPFVIAGDGTAQQLAAYRDQTILAAAKALWATYFDTRPAEPILILLFESEAPYKRLSKKWFDDGNVPHFGYYRQRDRVMVMNVATGTGTLVHELTHALIAPDFPHVPAWFNEGLASLYEQCTLSESSIRGLVNWRLPALQQAIRENKLRPLEELIADPDFYGPERSGLNYAEARYLMLYLQEHHMLVDYYRQFRDHATEDPTGIDTLRKIVAPKTVGQFETEWRAWVLRLGD